MIHWKHSSFCTFSSSVFFLFNLAFIVIYLLKINFSWTQWKSTVVVLSACLFCLCKIEKNKDEGEAKTFVLDVCYVMSIFVLHQGDETQQTVMAENCIFMRHQVFWNLVAALKYWGRIETLTTTLHILYNVSHLVLFTSLFLSFTSNYPSLSLTFLSAANPSAFSPTLPRLRHRECIAQYRHCKLLGEGWNQDKGCSEMILARARAGRSDRPEILISSLHRCSALEQGCCLLQAPRHSSKLISLITQHFPQKYNPQGHSSRAKAFGLEHSLREARGGEGERKFETCCLLPLRRLVACTYTQVF